MVVVLLLLLLVVVFVSSPFCGPPLVAHVLFLAAVKCSREKSFSRQNFFFSFLLPRECNI